MSDLIFFMSELGILDAILAVVVAFGAIAVYFGFIKKT